MVGFQVKTVGVDKAQPSATIAVRASSFRPAPTTYFAVLAWLRTENRFHEECLVIPSEELREFAQESEGHLKFEFHPGSTTQGRLNRFRHELAQLAAQVVTSLTHA